MRPSIRQTNSRPQRHHLDRRAARLAAAQGPSDELLDTKSVAEWLGVSPQFLEKGRVQGYGPTYIRLGPKRIRYRRLDVLSWLEQRRHASVSEYEGGAL